LPTSSNWKGTSLRTRVIRVRVSTSAPSCPYVRKVRYLSAKQAMLVRVQLGTPILWYNGGMETKNCVKCKANKNINDFSWKSQPKGLRQAKCKPCYQKLRNKWYKKNKSREITTIVAYRKNRRKELRAWLLAIKSKEVCKVCGEDRTPTLHFHHRNPAEKVDEVPVMVHQLRPLKVIELEISKCDILCANCHSMVHFNQDGEVL
jgi:predicted HNH restriction endonuclease